MLSTTQRKNRRRCLQIGNKLIDGPLAIFPATDNDDDYGWMECDFRISIYSGDYQTQESIAIYTDDTMNREENFFKPIIRHCAWDRSADENGSNTWPSAKVELAYLKDIEQTSEILIQIQEATPKLSFAPLGVSVSRNVAEVECDYYKEGYELYIRNGVQAITYASCYMPNDMVTALIFSSFKKLRNEMMVPFEKSGWKERYEYNLNNECPKDMWEWQYEV